MIVVVMLYVALFLSLGHDDAPPAAPPIPEAPVSERGATTLASPPPRPLPPDAPGGAAGAGAAAGDVSGDGATMAQTWPGMSGAGMAPGAMADGEASAAPPPEGGAGAAMADGDAAAGVSSEDMSGAAAGAGTVPDGMAGEAETGDDGAQAMVQGEAADGDAGPAATQAETPAGGAAEQAPQAPAPPFTTAADVRPIREATRANWGAVRPFGGQDLPYSTHLLSCRCGLSELRHAVNGGPKQPFPLPPCDLADPQPDALSPEATIYAPGRSEALPPSRRRSSTMMARPSGST